MMNASDSLYLDQNEVLRIRENCQTFLKNLNEKLSEQNCQLLHQRLEKMRDEISLQISNHIKLIMEQKNMDLDIQLNSYYVKFIEMLKLAKLQGFNIKTKLEQQIQLFENLINCLNQACSNSAGNNNIETNNNDVDFNEDDALMIDSINEFDNEICGPNLDFHAQEPSKYQDQANIKHNLETVFINIKKIINFEPDIDFLIRQLLSSDGSMFSSCDLLKFINCSPNVLTENCFGHFERNIDLKDTNQLLESLNHNKFEMQTKLNTNFSFVINEPCTISFICPDTRLPTTYQLADLNKDDFEDIFNHLRVDILDPNNSYCDEIDIKNKFQMGKRIIKLIFIPKLAGLYTLIIKYKNVNIKNSPFNFVVLPTKLSDSSLSTRMSSNYSGCYDSDLVLNNESNNDEIFSTDMNNNQVEVLGSNTHAIPTSSISTNNLEGANFNKNRSLGRGRLFNLTSSSAIKRTAVQSEQETNSIKNDYESSITDLSNQFKRSAFDYNIEHQTNPLMSLNVDTSFINEKSKLSKKNDAVMPLLKTSNILSTHLRRYTQNLIKVTDEKKIPPLKAEFICKYSNLSFPIGVRPCIDRDWLIVCDSGNHMLKVFEESTGNFLFEIKPDENREFTFKRPSAILIDKEISEIYVKDDKEIMVFDLNQKCKFLRRFGFQKLKRPYGLSFNKNKELVLVDADLKFPRIITFNKNDGSIIKESNYEPVNAAKSDVLNNVFNSNFVKLLPANIVPIQNTKIRFIYCNNNSLYASDLGRSIIFRTDLNGEMNLAFGHYGKKTGQLLEPSGLHVDDDGEALAVGDSKNDRVQIYDREGIYKTDIEFLNEKIVRPSDIHISQDGYIYVSCFIQHCVKKYKLVID